jgi:hypothetical protein
MKVAAAVVCRVADVVVPLGAIGAEKVLHVLTSGYPACLRVSDECDAGRASTTTGHRSYAGVHVVALGPHGPALQDSGPQPEGEGARVETCAARWAAKRFSVATGTVRDLP